MNACLNYKPGSQIVLSSIEIWIVDISNNDILERVHNIVTLDTSI